MTTSQTLALEHEGAALKGQLAIPVGQGGELPAVLIFHAGMGLGSYYIDRARQLAELGYVALAADMYGDGFHTDEPAEAGDYFLLFQNNPDLLRARVVAWHQHLKSLPQVDASRVAAIGYCFGGQCVLELVRSGAAIRAAVSFHGLLSTRAPAAPGSIDAVVAVYTGSKDPYAPREHVEALRGEMTAAGANLHITEFSDAYHAFTMPAPPRGVEGGMKYDELCARLAWAGTVTLLDSCLHPAA